LQKELSTEKVIKISKDGVANEFNTNAKLNELNIYLLTHTKALNADIEYDLDFDTQFIPCEKTDSKKAYKMEKERTTSPPF